MTSTTSVVRMMRKAKRHSCRNRLLGGGGISRSLGQGRNCQIAKHADIYRQWKFEEQRLPVQFHCRIGRLRNRATAKLQIQNLRFLGAFEFERELMALIGKPQGGAVRFATRDPRERC